MAAAVNSFSMVGQPVMCQALPGLPTIVILCLSHRRYLRGPAMDPMQKPHTCRQISTASTLLRTCPQKIL